jgi:hypothetical protein
MKPIKLPAMLHFQVDVDASGNWCSTDYDPEIFDICKKRGAQVIESTVFIERLIINILKSTLFRELKMDLEYVSGQLLESDKLSFMSKRKLLQDIIERDNLINGPKKDALNKSLKDIGSFRNAFAHGTIEIHGNKIIISYFETSPQKRVLDEPFWDYIEKIFTDASGILDEIMANAGNPERRTRA